MDIEELLVTLKMLDYKFSNIKWKNETCIYFETQELNNYEEKIIKDLNLIIDKYKNLNYIYDVILDTYCIVIYKNKKDANWF
jgi:hypothetical protein